MSRDESRRRRARPRLTVTSAVARQNRSRVEPGGSQWTVTSPEEPVPLEGGGRTVVHRRGNVVIRDTGPWTPAVHVLLRHLEDVGFAAAPRLVGSGLDPDGREVLTFIEGEFTQPGPWSLDGAAALGGLLRSLHEATRSLRPPSDAVWFPWHGRDLPSLAERARQLGAIADAYGLPAERRRGLLDRIIEFAITDTASEADDAEVAPETTSHSIALWSMAWRARSAAWMIRHRRTLDAGLNRGAS